jgi:triacylglycerol lipase
MLAQLLRRVLLFQVLVGALLAWALVANRMVTPVFALAIPLLLPLATLALAVVWTCFASRAQEPWRRWWQALAGEIWAGVRTFVIRQHWTRGEPGVLDPHGDPHRVPVVLVHGFVCNHRIWDDLTGRLRAAGHTVYTVNLEPLFGSIDQYPPIVEAAVQTLCKHTGYSQVALVGHSMGGLAIRAWMREFGTGRVAKVITLGTPHQGTAAHVPMPTTNSLQMQWQSAWLKELAASETADTRSLIRIAITPQDNIVYPQRAQTLEGIEPRVFEGIGHLQMCTNSQVIAWVVAELGDLTPTQTRDTDPLAGPT